MLAWIAGIGAVLCLVYYIIIAVYAGFSVSFSWFWLAAAGFLSFLSWGSRYCRLHPKKVPMWVTVPVMTCVAAAVIIFCVVEACVFVGAVSSEKPGLDYVIVLGAKVHERGISNSLRQRLNKAIQYSRKSPGTVLILSGGQGADEPMTEAQAMYQYLLENGVSPTRLIMEPVSSSTVENIAYSQLIILQREQSKRDLAGKGDGNVAPGPGGGKAGADRYPDQQLPCVPCGDDREEAGDGGCIRDRGRFGPGIVSASVRARMRGDLKGPLDG